MSPRIAFRDLKEADLPLLSDWLNKPHVAEWYGTDAGDDSSEDRIRAKYLPFINGDPRTSHFLILIDGEPSGLIQWYRVGDYPGYNLAVQVEPKSIAIDLFIGKENYVHRGFGPHIIQLFLAEVAFPLSGAEACYIGPATPNEAAIKAYSKAGFQYVKTVDVPGDRFPEHIMRLGRVGIRKVVAEAWW